ncbi:MAG: twin-arginine translocase TatA/TatE family subunit [Chloroflexi bacterium]|nr:twin-arginine translocase TatA/TatE family subunit [Chloroflexota bacterium]
MIKSIGPTELVLILLIVLIVFGVGRLGEIGGALGKGIREFRKATTQDMDEEPKADEKKAVEKKA